MSCTQFPTKVTSYRATVSALNQNTGVATLSLLLTGVWACMYVHVFECVGCACVHACMHVCVLSPMGSSAHHHSQDTSFLHPHKALPCCPFVTMSPSLHFLPSSLTPFFLIRILWFSELIRDALSLGIRDKSPVLLIMDSVA